MDGVTNEAERIPLPLEIPKAPDLSSLPASVLHSGTVETLLGQNEDLMARLKVNIRRNSLLEQQIMEQERVTGELSRVNATLTSQLQVFQEKDRFQRDRSQRTEELQELLKQEQEALRGKLASAERLNERIKSAARYLRRVRRWVRPMIERLHEALEGERQLRLSKEAQLSDLKNRLGEAILHSQGLERQITRDQARLIEQYETAQRKLIEQAESGRRQLEAEVARMKAEQKLLRDKAERFDEITSQNVDLENRVITLERTAHEAEARAGEYRREAKTLALEAASREKELSEAKQIAADLRVSNMRLLDQFESLQAVWGESQKRLEAAKLQHETLNRLNQELSRELRKARASTDSQDLGA